MWTFLGKNKHRSKSQTMSLASARDIVNAFTPVYEQIAPPTPSSPIILASPHSGRLYPEAFLAQTGLSLATLRRVEDAFVDDIFRPLAAHGFSFLSANFPRVITDVNRSADEWPPESKAQISKRPFSISPRARAGLGVVPMRVAVHENIYEDVLPAAHVALRIKRLHVPYHKALSGLLNHTKTKFGRAVLLDCHSMPALGENGQRNADIVLGNRFGEACHGQTIDTLRSILQGFGYDVRLNDPYAGGYVTAHYGKPHTGTEAIQIEINKDLYLDTSALLPHQGMEKLARNLQSAILQFAHEFERPADIAAQ